MIRRLKNLIEQLAAGFIAKANKPWMDRMNFKNVRLNLRKHNGLWVVVFLCTDYPFEKGSPFNSCDSSTMANCHNEHCCHAIEPDSESYRHSDSDEVP